MKSSRAFTGKLWILSAGVILLSAVMLFVIFFHNTPEADKNPGDGSSPGQTDQTDTRTPPEGTRSGHLTSNSGTHLNLYADWELLPSDDGKEMILTLQIGITSYSILVGERKNLGTVTANGVQKTFSSPRIESDANQKTVHFFETLTFVLPITEGEPFVCHLSVSWPFNGTYGGKEVGVLKIESTIS